MKAAQRVLALMARRYSEGQVRSGVIDKHDATFEAVQNRIYAEIQYVSMSDLS